MTEVKIKLKNNFQLGLIKPFIDSCKLNYLIKYQSKYNNFVIYDTVANVDDYNIIIYLNPPNVHQLTFFKYIVLKHFYNILILERCFKI